MNHLPESQQLVIMFLAGMLSRSPSIVEELDKAVQSDFLIPAEVCMARPQWKEKEIFNLDEVTELHTKAARPPTLEGPPPPVAEPTVAADVNASVEASANAGQVETAEQSASQWLPDGMEPEQQAAQRTVTEHFPHLVLSDSQCDMLKRVSAEKLEAVLTHARVRAGRNISIIVGEPLTADFHGMDRADKRTHLLVGRESCVHQHFGQWPGQALALHTALRGHPDQSARQSHEDMVREEQRRGGGAGPADAPQRHGHFPRWPSAHSAA